MRVQGEDEAKPKKQDTSRMTPSTVAYLESRADSAAPADGDREYALAPHVQEQIGRRLAAVYDEILRQPIPERFLRLLDQLDQAQTAKDRSSAKEKVTETLDHLGQTARTTKQRSSARETEID
jgi:Anti-sigma factor NepR